MKCSCDTRQLLKRSLSAVVAMLTVILYLSTVPNASASGENNYDSDSFAIEIVLLVNEARTQAGLRPLKVVPYINDCADIRSSELLTKLSHIRPDGTSFGTVFDQDRLPLKNAYENIGYGYETAEEVFEEWKNSSAHWKHIMDPAVTHTGVSFLYDENSDYGWYWDELFVTMEKEGFTVLPGEYIPERHKIIPKSSGDIDGDAEISPFDLITLIQYICGYNIYLNDLQLESADTLKDGSITISDAVVLRKYLIGAYRTLPMTMDMILSQQ